MSICFFLFWTAKCVSIVAHHSTLELGIRTYSKYDEGTSQVPFYETMTVRRSTFVFIKFMYANSIMNCILRKLILVTNTIKKRHHCHQQSLSLWSSLLLTWSFAFDRHAGTWKPTGLPDLCGFRRNIPLIGRHLEYLKSVFDQQLPSTHFCWFYTHQPTMLSCVFMS